MTDYSIDHSRVIPFPNHVDIIICTVLRHTVFLTSRFRNRQAACKWLISDPLGSWRQVRQIYARTGVLPHCHFPFSNGLNFLSFRKMRMSIFQGQAVVRGGKIDPHSKNDNLIEIQRRWLKYRNYVPEAWVIIL